MALSINRRFLFLWNNELATLFFDPYKATGSAYLQLREWKKEHELLLLKNKELSEKIDEQLNDLSQATERYKNYFREFNECETISV